MAGRKNDIGKPRMDLIPPEAMIGLANVLTFGAEKYEDRNWEHGMDWGRVYAAMQRHQMAWWGGENLDPESGLSHLDHILFGAAALKTFEVRKTGTDTRWDSEIGRDEQWYEKLPDPSSVSTDNINILNGDPS